MVEVCVDWSVVTTVVAEPSVVSVGDVTSPVPSVVSLVDEESVVAELSPDEVVVSSVVEGVVTVGPDEGVLGGETVEVSVEVVLSGKVVGASGPGPVLTVVGLPGSVVGVVTVVDEVLSMVAVSEVNGPSLPVGPLGVVGSVSAPRARVVRIA